MSKMVLPPGDYREDLLEILTFPGAMDIAYREILSEAEENVLTEALDILTGLPNSKTRIERINAEFKRRKRDETMPLRWKKSFTRRWNEMRKAAGK